MTIYTITFNEQFMLPHFIAHYRGLFPNCRIVVYDNYSTDRTVEIAKANNCEVRLYDTNGKLDDLTYLKIKNNCWKETKGWVIIADCDEFVDYQQSTLETAEKQGYTALKAEGYNMVNLSDELDFNLIEGKVRAKSYDKIYCFNTKEIKEINYGAGCHNAEPKGNVLIKNIGVCHHYKYVQIDYMIKRHEVFASRLSDENIKNHWGTHYLYSAENIRKEFLEARKNAIKII